MKKSFILFLLPLCLTACGGALSLEELKDVQIIHSEHQELYLLDNNPSNIGKYSAFASKEGYANPTPIVLKWKGGKAPYTVSVSEKEDMSNPYSEEVSKKTYDFYNAKINTTYYWTVKSGDKVTEVSSFSVKGTSLRNIFVDGVDNFRDLGGYVTSDGKVVKQGMIYRSGHFNEAKQTSMKLIITDNGLKTVNNQLKIKTDIDLRKNVASDDGTIETSGITSSPLGSSVTYKQMPMYYDGQNILEHSEDAKREINLNSVKLFFEALADESNYPIVFHCVQGKDRTGCLSYLLGALLGEKEEDLYRDYLFTNFSNSVGSPCKLTDISNRYGLTINNYEGETLQEKTYNYLKTEIGVNKDNLKSIASLLLQ